MAEINKEIGLDDILQGIKVGTLSTDQRSKVLSHEEVHLASKCE